MTRKKNVISYTIDKIWIPNILHFGVKMNTKLAGITVAVLGGIAAIIASFKPSPACETGHGLIIVQSCGNKVDYNSQKSEKLEEPKIK